MTTIHCDNTNINTRDKTPNPVVQKILIVSLRIGKMALAELYQLYQLDEFPFLISEFDIFFYY